MRILIVDDEEMIRDSIGEYIEDEGFEVVCAGNGKEALAVIFGNEKLDLVLLDIAIPEPDGIALCKEIKADERTMHIPVIIFTAKSAPEDILKAKAAGADTILMKPADDDEIIKKIKSLLS